MAQQRPHLFVLGKDYHLGDLLWLTVVLAAYRRQHHPEALLLMCPDRPISRILEQNPLIDTLIYAEARGGLTAVRTRYGAGLVVHDLRPGSLAVAMLRAWRQRRPWHYYLSMWLDARGQWLATFLQLGRLREHRPVLCLVDEDRATARRLPPEYVVLAPHVGRHTLPLLDSFWHRLKGWPDTQWAALAVALRDAGYAPVTLAASGQTPIPGTLALTGLPIREAAGVIERAAALVTVESGLWYIAAALGTPLVIVPWWLPRAVDWVAPMAVPYALIYRDQSSVQAVFEAVQRLSVRQQERQMAER
jgi:ADP-heptose:LPS heptosyltransferase